MSGGLGPAAADMASPEEEEEAPPPSSAPLDHPSRAPPTRRRRRFLSFHHLNALAVAVVLTFTGMVAPQDLAFALFSLAYLYLLSSVAFPQTLAESEDDPPIFGGGSALALSLYVAAGALLGLFLPVAYVLHGVVEGDKEGIKAAVPHVFLLACQVFMEGVASTRRFSLPMRVFVPVLYNSRRLFTIGEWLREEIEKEAREEHGSAVRLQVGRTLAVVNMAFWGFNLFGFLLPVYFPRAFQRYYLDQSLGKKKKN